MKTIRTKENANVASNFEQYPSRRRGAQKIKGYEKRTLRAGVPAAENVPNFKKQVSFVDPR